jgi:hypothetical protein
MALTSTQIANLNNMCKGAYDGTLGTTLATIETSAASSATAIAKLLGGTYTADADDASAGSIAIDTGKTIAGAVVTVLRSGIAMADVAISYATTVLTIDTNSTDYVITNGDVINYVVFTA